MPCIASRCGVPATCCAALTSGAIERVVVKRNALSRGHMKVLHERTVLFRSADRAWLAPIRARSLESARAEYTREDARLAELNQIRRLMDCGRDGRSAGSAVVAAAAMLETPWP